LSIQDIQVIEVSLRDLPVLQEISKRTFYDSFAADNTAENMSFHLSHYFTEEKLTNEILNPCSKFFFAIKSGLPVGYLKINSGPAQTVLPNIGGFEIERIYVDQSCKGAGIGKLFIGKSIELAVAAGAKFIWLGVWEHNSAAIRFYEKNGFKKFSQHIFKVGDDAQTDLLMHRTL
jgi:ribosomal protein S18 acetylase RimI-like enzyme